MIYCTLRQAKATQRYMLQLHATIERQQKCCWTGARTQQENVKVWHWQLTICYMHHASLPDTSKRQTAKLRWIFRQTMATMQPLSEIYCKQLKASSLLLCGLVCAHA